MKEVMNDHYENMKDKTGLRLAEREAEREDKTSDKIFKILRPKSDMTFHEYIDYENTKPKSKQHQEASKIGVKLHTMRQRPQSNKSRMLH